MLPPLRRLRRLVPVLLLTAVAACTPYSTYPPVETGEALVPWMYPVPQVMSKSLRTAYEKTVGALEVPNGRPDLVFALPEGVSTGVWDQVGVDTGIDGARSMTEEDMALGTPVWSIEQVRVRNLRAEVDVIFPVTDGYERATLILESEPFKPFVVKFFQRWRVPVEPPVFTGASDAESEVEVDAEATDSEVEAEPAEEFDV